MNKPRGKLAQASPSFFDYTWLHCFFFRGLVFSNQYVVYKFLYVNWNWRRDFLAHRFLKVGGIIGCL